MTRAEIERANLDLTGRDPKHVLAWACHRFGAGRVGLATSLSAEDQVLIEAAAGLSPHPAVFTLDTGRLFGETYDLIDANRARYGVRIEVLFPDRAEVEAMVAAHGVNLFYHSADLRKECCRVRKVNVLRRRLQTLGAWATGLRREQAVTRESLAVVEWDEAHGCVKLNPLADWTEDQVWSCLRERGIPHNPLHDRGFPSIGCAPCTRAVAPGEDVRSGRWWWEPPEQKECGLHVRDGKLVRAGGASAPAGDVPSARNAPEER